RPHREQDRDQPKDVSLFHGSFLSVIGHRTIGGTCCPPRAMSWWSAFLLKRRREARSYDVKDRSTACLSTAAHPEEIFGFLPLAARFAVAAADLRTFLARLRSRSARFAALAPASSMRFVALPNFVLTLDGTA